MNDIPVSPSLPDYSSWLSSLLSWIVSLYPGFIIDLKNIFGFLIGISIPLSLFFLIGIIYCVEGLKRIRNKEELIYDTKTEPAYDAVQDGDSAMAHRFEKASSLIESANPNDWKQAIIEADILLDDLLTKMGYRGESIGEKLKRVVPGDFKTLDEAWEGHKVRNSIAHESGFQLDHHEAKRAFHSYKKVFEEFYYI